MNDLIMDLDSFEASLIGGLMDSAEVAEMMQEIKSAPVGYIKPNEWEKISDNSVKVYSL